MEIIQCTRVYADIDQINGCRKRISKVKNEIKDLSGSFNLAGNNARFSILFLLYEEKLLCVCDLSDILSLTIPAVSQHLRKLKDGNLIKSNKAGQTIFYSLTEGGMGLFDAFFQLVSNKYVDSKQKQAV